MHFHHFKISLFGLAIVVALNFIACTEEFSTAPQPLQAGYEQYPGSTVTYLVTDIPDQYPGARPDPLLINGWGIVSDHHGWLWVAAEGSGVILGYDQHGNPVHPPIGVPSSGEEKPAPTGIVYNKTTGFVLPGQGPAQLIVAGTDGSISAWSGGPEATLVVPGSGAAYTGLAINTNARGESYLYAADFAKGKIDVYDQNFTLVSGMPFSDPALPEGFAPYNVTAIGRLIYVTYAKRGPDGKEERGPGLGFVNVFSFRGMFVKRLATGPELNAPWGIAALQSSPYELYSKLYIANFGDGTIATYDQDGNFTGMMHDAAGDQVRVDGLWGIMFAPVGMAPGIDPNALWFAAGPADEQHGTFGFIQPK